MVREPRGLPAAVLGGAKERHMRHSRSQLDPSAPVPPGLVAKLAVPKSKHHTYFEFVENKNKKKKKLELEVTTKKEPPPGFAYVPIGNPDLTTTCKEISRERDAMIFIVSTSKAGASNQISGQVHRIGHHIRESIVEEAKASLALLPRSPPVTCPNGQHEPIPESQQEYLAQADAALRDLFPRIPNTDRQAIINHSFTRGLPTKGEPPVGLCQDISLARRVQLAVLAHIRHVHTRYDQLLKETTWQNARKVVEQLCLDTLVQWRGDEETGRDQLDEILREVVVISDSEPGDSEYESTDETWTEERDMDPDACPSSVVVTRPEPITTAGIDTPMAMQSVGSPPQLYEDTPLVAATSHDSQRPRSQRRNQRGFKRYRAWEEALRRNRDREHSDYPIAMDTGSASYSTYPHQAPIHSQAPVRGTAFGVPATPRPVTPPPSQDIPIPSIESFSPPSMPPAFVRSVPSRLPPPEALYPPPCWDNQSQYQVNIPSRNAGMMISGETVQFPARLPQPPMHNQYAPIRSRQVTHVPHSEPSMPNPTEPWPPYGSVVARRITMDVNRPGERSNPIIMEDRGGFFERVSQPEEHGVAALEAPVLVREVRRWSRPLEQPYSPRLYAAAHGDCPLTTQDQYMSGVETYTATREAPSMISMSVSQSASHVEHLSGYPSPRRDVQQQNGRGSRDGQFVHERNREYGARSPGYSSPRRWRGNIIVLE